MVLKTPESTGSKIKRRAKEALRVIVVQNVGLVIQVVVLLILIAFVFSIQNSTPLYLVDVQSNSLSGIQSAITTAVDTSNITDTTTYSGIAANDTQNYEVSSEFCSAFNIDTEKFLYFAMIPAALVTLTFMFFQKRKRIGRYCCGMKPGSIYPINLFEEQSDRGIYAAAIVLCAWPMFEIITGSLPFSWIETAPTQLKIFYKILACLMYGFLTSPVFAGIASKHLVGYVCGSLFAWMITIVFLLDWWPCWNQSKFSLVLHWFELTPLLICMLFVSLSLTYRAVMQLKRSLDPSYKTPKIEIHHVAYVKNLLRKPNKEAKTPFYYKLHTPVKGFRYPLAILMSNTLAAIIVYLLGLILYEFVISKVKKHQVTSQYQLQQWNQYQTIPHFGTLITAIVGSTGTVLVWGLKELIVWLDLIEVCLYLTLAVAWGLFVAGVIFTFKRYRQHLMEIQRGIYREIPLDRLNPTPTSVAVNSCKYVGFRVGYAVWGFVLQFLLFFVITLLIGGVILCAVRYGWKEYMLTLFEIIWPILVLGWVVSILQIVLTTFLFLQENDSNGRYLAVNNRRWFFNFQYYMIFVNTAIGFGSCLLRIVFAVVLGVWAVPRLDLSTLSRWFESMDAGFSSYVCLLKFQNQQNNPIMVVFIKLLVLSLFDKREYQPEKRPYSEVLRVKLAQNQLSGKAKRNKWRMLLTLHNNPSLLYQRKKLLALAKDKQTNCVAIQT